MKLTKFYEVPKGWGKEIWFWNSDKYCYKHLCFDKNKKCSFHFHVKKDEIFHVLKGNFGYLRWSRYARPWRHFPIH